MSGLVPQQLFPRASECTDSLRCSASQREPAAVSMWTLGEPFLKVITRADSGMSSTTLEYNRQPGQPLQPLAVSELGMDPESSMDDLLADEDPDQGLTLDTFLSRNTASAQQTLVAVAPLSQHCMADPPIISISEAAFERARQRLDLPDLCDSCRKFLSDGNELAARIQAERLSNEVKQQTGSFIARAVCGCTKVVSSSGEPSNPCLFADRQHLADNSIGRSWGLVLSKARDAEVGRKRAPNGTKQPWNTNFNTNSPVLLQQQGDLLLVLDPSSRSSGVPSPSSSTVSNSSAHSTQTASVSSAAAATSGRKVPGLYSVLSTDNKAHVTAYAVACYGPAPAVRIGAAAEPPAAAAMSAYGHSQGHDVKVDLTSYLWCSKMKCSKRSHALKDEELELFRYALVVFMSENGADGGASPPQKKLQLVTHV